MLKKILAFLLFTICLSSYVLADDLNLRDAMGSFRGVTAYSNGEYTALTNVDISIAQYQCVEYVKRFYGNYFGIPLSQQAIGVARNYFTEFEERNLSRFALYKHPNNGSVAPRIGDILVFDNVNNIGHVAIVTGVSSSTVSIIEQNWSRNTCLRNLPITKSKGNYIIAEKSGYSVLGWVGPSVFKFTDNNTVYLYSNNQLWPIANQFVYSYLGFRSDNCASPTPDWSKVVEVSANKRSDFTVRSEVVGVGGLPPDRKISYRITTAKCYSAEIDSTKLYALTKENGQTKFNYISDWDTYVALGYSENSNDIIDISYDLIEYYGEGNPINLNNITVWISGASNFVGDYEELEFPELTPVVYPPTNLRYCNLTATNVTVLWDKGFNVDDANLTWGVYQDGAKIATASAKTYTVTGLSSNTPHTFKVRAIKGSDESDFSNVLSVTTPEKVSVYPVNFNFVEMYNSEYVEPLSEAARINNEPVRQNSYCRGGSHPTVFVLLNEVSIPGALPAIWRWYDPSGSQYLEENSEFYLDYGTQWWFYQDIELSSSNNYGTWSVQVILDSKDLGRSYFEFAPCLAAPNNTSSSNVISNGLRLNWEAVNYATGYEVFRKDGDSWNPKGNVSALYFDDTGLEPGTTYHYRLFSTAGSYTSVTFTEISVTTTSQSTGVPAAPQNLRRVNP